MRKCPLCSNDKDIRKYLNTDTHNNISVSFYYYRCKECNFLWEEEDKMNKKTKKELVEDIINIDKNKDIVNKWIKKES